MDVAGTSVCQMLPSVAYKRAAARALMERMGRILLIVTIYGIKVFCSILGEMAKDEEK